MRRAAGGAALGHDQGLEEALVGLTRAEAEGLAGAQQLHVFFRTAGPVRPGTEPRVVRARVTPDKLVDVVCAGFLQGPGGDGRRDPEVRT